MLPKIKSMKGMLDTLPRPMLALLVAVILLVIAYAIANGGLDKLKEILVPSLPQNILNIGGG